MARRCGRPNKPCGMAQGLYNPFFQNGAPWMGSGVSSSQVIADAFNARVTADGGTYEADECLVDQIENIRNLGFYDAASLILTPNGYKPTKLYSLKPISGAGDFTFSRSGTRTRVDSSGLIVGVATDVPAIDYTNSVCPYISLLPQRTNLLLRSKEFDNATWTKTATTVNANAIVGPDGLQTVDAVMETVTSSSHLVQQTVTKSAASIQYTFSATVKILGRDWVQLQTQMGGNAIRAWFNINTGVVGSTAVVGTGWSVQGTAIEPAPNGFYTCSVTVTTDANTSILCTVFSRLSDLDTSVYVGDITKGFYIAHAQLETGGYATSQIETTSATVTRIQDSVTALTGVTSLIGQTEGVIYFEGESFADGTEKSISFSDGTVNNRIVIQFTSSNTINALVVSGGATQASIANAGFTTGITYKIAIVYASNRCAIFIDGVKVGEDLTVTVPSCSSVRYDSGAGSNIFLGNQYLLGISKTALTDQELINLTS